MTEIRAEMVANVWQVKAAQGATVAAGDERTNSNPRRCA